MDPLPHHPTHRIGIARAASQPGIGAAKGGNHQLCYNHRDTARYQRSSGAANAARADAQIALIGSNQMGDWRDTDRSH
jgi:hypothetical protein